MGFHDFRITSTDDGHYQIFVDGVEQRGVTACDIRIRQDEVPSITLQYLFRNVDAALAAGAIEAIKTYTDGVLEKDIDSLGLSCRAYNVVKRGVWHTWMDSDFNRTLGDLMIAYRTGHLKNYHGMGTKTYQEVIDKLKEIGLLDVEAK